MQNDQNIYQFDFADNPEQQQQDDIAALLAPPDDMSRNSIAVSDALHNTLMVSPFQCSVPPAPASQTAHIQHDCECTGFSDWSSEESLAPFNSTGSGSSHAVQFDRPLTPKPMNSSLGIPISSAALHPIFPHPSGNAVQYAVQRIAPSVTRLSNLASIAGTPALLYPTIWKPVKFTIDLRRKAHVHATVEQEERNHRHSISHPSLTRGESQTKVQDTFGTDESYSDDEPIITAARVSAESSPTPLRDLMGTINPSSESPGSIVTCKVWNRKYHEYHNQASGHPSNVNVRDAAFQTKKVVDRRKWPSPIKPRS